MSLVLTHLDQPVKIVHIYVRVQLLQTETHTNSYYGIYALSSNTQVFFNTLCFHILEEDKFSRLSHRPLLKMTNIATNRSLSAVVIDVNSVTNLIKGQN